MHQCHRQHRGDRAAQRGHLWRLGFRPGAYPLTVAWELLLASAVGAGAEQARLARRAISGPGKRAAGRSRWSRYARCLVAGDCADDVSEHACSAAPQPSPRRKPSVPSNACLCVRSGARALNPGAISLGVAELPTAGTVPTPTRLPRQYLARMSAHADHLRTGVERGARNASAAG